MEFSPASDKILIFSPHPDDDILAAGGFLQHIVQKNIPVRIVYVTDGDNNPWPQRAIERRWFINKSDRRRWGCRRQQEVIAALKQLGIGSEHATFLGMPDQGLTSLLVEQKEAVVRNIAKIIAAWDPTVILSPALSDLHPDHSAFAVILTLALQSLVSRGKSPVKVLYFSIHPSQPHRGIKLSISLSSRQIAVKKAALLQHYTQMRLSSRRFMNYVREREDFYNEPFFESEHSCHPLKMSFVQDGYLHLVLNKPGLTDRLFRPVLYVMPATNPNKCISLRLNVLPHGKVNILDFHGSTILAVGEVLGLMNFLLIKIPENILGRTEEIYVKQVSKSGFFDHAGWKLLPLSRAHAEEELPYAKTIVLIPCYNVARLCTGVISETLRFADQVIVIDDGSTDTTGAKVSSLLTESRGRLHVISKKANEGKGSALLDGMRYVLENFDFSALVTIDGDGQHRPADIPRAAHTVLQGKDLVIGQRNFAGMPMRSSFGNNVTREIFSMLYPKSPCDTQSGFRAFSSKFVREIVTCIHRGRYETELYILLLAMYLGMEMDTFQIDTIYIDENRSSHFRPVVDSVRIMFSLLRWQLGTII